MKPYSAALDLNVTVAQRGEAKRGIRPGVLVIANADESGLQQADHSGNNLLAWQAGPFQIVLYMFADNGQSFGKRKHPVELGFIPDLPVAGMIAVLATTPRINAGRLQMSVLEGADPDVLPGRWDYQRPYAAKRFAVTNGTTIEVKIGKTLSGGSASKTG
jgi:hypothetical protein